MSRPNELIVTAAAASATSFGSVLEPGEQVLWSGRPIFARYLRSGPLYLIPFSVAWCAFAIFWEAGAIGMGDLFFDLWGAMFVAFGLYFVGGRYYVLARQARSALYAVTDRRVLLVGGAFRPKLTEMRLGSLPAVTVEQDLTGVGLITFGPVTRYAAFARAGLPMGSGEVSPVFLAIERPSEVARIIEEAQRSADVGAHPGSRLASAG